MTEVSTNPNKHNAEIHIFKKSLLSTFRHKNATATATATAAPCRPDSRLLRKQSLPWRAGPFTQHACKMKFARC